jgi:hypothetical protein
MGGSPLALNVANVWPFNEPLILISSHVLSQSSFVRGIMPHLGAI